MTPPTVDAYYNPTRNLMVFPAGILQAPFYSSSAPLAMNFGAIGSVMGHELTHGFDDEGRQFDGDGNLEDWWTPSVGAEFDHRASCVADQFDGYVAVDDIHVNGKLDSGREPRGSRRPQARARIPSLPGPRHAGRGPTVLPRLRPGVVRTRAPGGHADASSHGPALAESIPRERTVSNLSAFAAAFSCQAGDPMVRPAEKQCSVW